MHCLSDIIGLNHLAPVELAVGRDQRRVDVSRKDNRYFNPVLAHFLVKRLGKAYQTDLGSGRSRSIRFAALCPNRALMGRALHYDTRDCKTSPSSQHSLLSAREIAKIMRPGSN